MKKLMIAVFTLAMTWNASAGCRINIWVENTGDYNISIANYGSHAGVKTKGGIWRGLHQGQWFRHEGEISVGPGEFRGDDYDGAFGCKAKRRYRIRYACLNGPRGGSEFSVYYPSPTGWTTDQEISVVLPKCK